MKSSKGTKKRNTIRVNFEGVETRTKIDDGEYHSKVVETSVEEGNEAPYIKWTFEIIEDGPHQGRKLYTNTSLSPKALWNLRNLLETMGVETPDSETELDLDSYKDLELMLRVQNEVWDGKERPKVTDFSPVEESVSTEEDEPKAAKSAKSKAKPEDEEDADGEDETEDAESEGDEAEEETDKLTAAEVREMDETELADLVKQHKLKIDLSKIAKKSKRIAAVIDALEAKDLLADEE